MCFRIFFGVYILLLIVSTVISHTIPDNHHDGDSKIPKHHTRSKSSKNEHKLAKALAIDDFDPKAVREHDHHNEKIDDDHREVPNLENIAIKPEEDVSRTGISDGTNTEIHLDHNLDLYDDYDIENSRAENDVTDKLEQIEENNQAVDYSSSTLSNIYQDAMIDVKGRNGEALMEDGRRSGMPDENIYNMRPVVRNPAIPEDYVDSIFKPHDFRKEYFNQPRINYFRYNNDMMPQIYNKRLTYKDLLEPLLRQNNPFYYNMINSKETTYPRPANGHETLWGPSNNGHNIATNFGIPSYSSSEMLCSTCHQKSVLNSHEHRRSIELPYITANGRRLEFVPVDSNAYPLARDADISTQNPEINGSEDAREGRAQQSESFGGNQDIEQMHKIVIQKSNPIVMNGRMGLTGYHIISGF